MQNHYFCTQNGEAILIFKSRKKSLNGKEFGYR